MNEHYAQLLRRAEANDADVLTALRTEAERRSDLYGLALLDVLEPHHTHYDVTFDPRGSVWLRTLARCARGPRRAARDVSWLEVLTDGATLEIEALWRTLADYELALSTSAGWLHVGPVEPAYKVAGDPMFDVLPEAQYACGFGGDDWDTWVVVWNFYDTLVIAYPKDDEAYTLGSIASAIDTALTHHREGDELRATFAEDLEAQRACFTPLIERARLAQSRIDEHFDALELSEPGVETRMNELGRLQSTFDDWLTTLNTLERDAKRALHELQDMQNAS